MLVSKILFKIFKDKSLYLLTVGILELYTCKVCEMFVYKHKQTMEYAKN